MTPHPVRTLGIALRDMTALLVLLFASSAYAEASLHYFWPRFPRPETVLTVKSVPNREMAILLDTLSGLAAADTLRAQKPEMIWSPLNHPSYERWFHMMLQQTHARVEGPSSIWDQIPWFKGRGIVRGYILYRYDDSSRGYCEDGPVDVSANVATSLCPSFKAIAVSEGLEAKAKEMGLARLLDVRNMTEEQCFAQYKDRFSRDVVALQDPKVNEIRSEAVALGAFVLSRPGPLYEKALARLRVDTPVLGWGIGDEMEITKPATEWTHFITATNWCHNLPLLSTERPGETYPAERLAAPHPISLWDVPWEEDVQYASFLMSDGDNVQWLMGDFVEDEYKCYWSHPGRGSVPTGWTCCYADLAQLCPYALDYLFASATNNDDFVLFGGGYYYPDRFGSNRPESSALQLHARRMAAYMRLGKLRTLAVNTQKWDSPEALAAYETYAREIPELDGIFAIQYAPYTAGQGAVKWVARRNAPGSVPVISARFSIWANKKNGRDDCPSNIAAQLNAMPHAGPPATDDRFSWVIVHAWSWFNAPDKNAPPGAEEIDQHLGGQQGTGRGFSSVKWCCDLLEPHVRIVAPSALVQLMHLRIHPEQTLSRALNELDLEAQQADADATRDSNTLKEIAGLAALARKSLAAGDYRNCFETAKKLRDRLGGTN